MVTQPRVPALPSAAVIDDADESAAWRGEELFGHPDWEVRLDPDEARAAGSRPRPWLEGVRRALETGPGAVRLRGLELDGLHERELERRFLDLASQLGTPVSQSADGERLLRVRDEGFASDDPRFRGPHSSRRLGFHTDRCDVIAFLCVRPARAGGETHLVSSVTLARELARRDPAALAVLREPFPYLRHTVDAGNARPWTGVPVFTEHDGRFAACYLRVLIDRADRSEDAPSLTPEQRAALDALDMLAEERALQARFTMQRGDLLLLNNWVTFHRRTAFEDDPDPARRRLLLRLWLSVPNSRALDPRLAAHFGATAAGALRGGIHPADGARRGIEPGSE